MNTRIYINVMKIHWIQLAQLAYKNNVLRVVYKNIESQR